MVNRTNPEFINRIKFSPSPSIDKERINITLIQNTDIKDAYTNVVKRVSEFEKKMEEAEAEAEAELEEANEVIIEADENEADENEDEE